MTPLCFIDTESDGIHPDRLAWEIALIRRDDSGERTQHLFVDIDLSTADPFGLRVGRFYDRHPLGRVIAGVRHCDSPTPPVPMVEPGKAAHTVARMTHGAHLVGAVPNFDAEIFDRLLREHGLCPSWHYHLIDVEALAVGYLAGQFSSTGNTPPSVARPPWKSDLLMDQLGVDMPSEEERHTALGDARWAQRVYDRVMGGA